MEIYLHKESAHMSKMKPIGGRSQAQHLHCKHAQHSPNAHHNTGKQRPEAASSEGEVVAEAGGRTRKRSSDTMVNAMPCGTVRETTLLPVVVHGTHTHTQGAQ